MFKRITGRFPYLANASEYLAQPQRPAAEV
jgi:hypothetical protein